MGVWEDWLANKAATRCLLVEAKAYSGAAEVTRYLGTHALVTAPGDTPSNTIYYPRISGDVSFKREMAEVFLGQTVVSWGGIDIDNRDGEYDSWVNDAWDGRDITLKLGDPSWAISAFGTILTGKIERLEVSGDKTLTLYIRDKQLVLDVPIQDTLLTTGERTGEPVPLCMGNVRSLTPVLIDTSFLIYQVHDGEINAISAVYDGGVTLNYQSSTLNGAINSTVTSIVLASASAFSVSGVVRIEDEYVAYTGITTNTLTGCTRGYAGSTAASHATSTAVDGSDYAKDLVNGKFILGGSPVYQITCDIQGAKPSTYMTKPGELLKYMVSTIGPLATGELDTTALTALDTDAPYTLGLYVRDRSNLLDECDQVSVSVGGYYGFDRAGDFTCGILTTPTGTAVVDFDELEMLGDIEVEIIGPPRWRSRLGYQKCWTVQDRDSLGGSVSDATAAFLEQEYRTEVSTATGVKVAHLHAADPEREDTLIDTSVNAATEVARRQTLWGSQRYVYTIEAFATPFQLDLNDVVSVTDDRYSLNGTKMRVISIEEWPVESRIRVGLWK